MFFDTERFISNAHLLPPVPSARAKLIYDGISRSEYQRRFGIDDASLLLFQSVEFSRMRKLILNLLKTNPDGLTSVQLAQMLGADRRSVTTRLNELKEMNEVRGEKMPGHARFVLNWIANSPQPKPPLKHDFSGNWPTVKDIQNVVADDFNLTTPDLLEFTKVKCVSRARFVAVYLCQELKPEMSSFDLGARFGGRDHSTIVHALKRARALIAAEPEFGARVEKLRAFLAAKRRAPK